MNEIWVLALPMSIISLLIIVCIIDSLANLLREIRYTINEVRHLRKEGNKKQRG